MFLILLTDGMQLPINHLQQVVNGTLTILKVRKTYDAGKYTCFAENSAGQGMDRSVFVNVLGNYDRYFKQEQHYVRLVLVDTSETFRKRLVAPVRVLNHTQAGRFYAVKCLP